MQEPDKPAGRRRRDREHIREQIAAAGVRLFLEHGYEATTLDAIAAAAGVSRRTFFNYFASKDDVLLARPGQGFPAAVGPALRNRSASERPIDAVRDVLIELVDRFETPDALAIQHLLYATPQLRAHKQSVYAMIEAEIVAAMKDVWSGAHDEGALVMSAMMAIGAFQIAHDRWREAEARRPLATHVADAFRDLYAASPVLP